MAYKPTIKKLDFYGGVPTGTSDPASACIGDMFYNTTDTTLKIWIDGAWVDVGGGAVDPATFDFMDGSDFLFMDDSGFDFMDA